MVKKWNVTIPKLSGDKPRRAYICLPESYDTSKDKRYPVMYMFDGHNVFFDEDATFGKSWGMAKYMRESKKELIIVGVECNHEGNRRLVEYAPFTYTNSEHGHIKGKGSILMNWLVNTLKPYIDANYRTLPDRKNTIIAGWAVSLPCTAQRCITTSSSGPPACLPASGFLRERFWKWLPGRISAGIPPFIWTTANWKCSTTPPPRNP